MLHRPQIGNRLSNVVFPPLLSGMLCPHWKSKTLIRFLHQVTLHFPSNFSPTHRSHTCSRSAFGILVFRYGDSVFTRVATLECITLLRHVGCILVDTEWGFNPVDGSHGIRCQIRMIGRLRIRRVLYRNCLSDLCLI